MSNANRSQAQSSDYADSLPEPTMTNEQSGAIPQGSDLQPETNTINVINSVIDKETSMQQSATRVGAEPSLEAESVETVNVRSERDESAQSTVRAPLYRHPTHQILGGVCGGLAEYLNLDPVLVRLLWVVMTIPTAGAGFLAYIVLWLLLPVGTARGGQHEPAALNFNESSIRRAGSVLVIIGGLWLLANVGILPWIWNAFWSVMSVVFWPALLIGAGLLLLKNQKEWRVGFGEWRSRMRVKMPQASNPVRIDRESVRNGLRSAQQRIPLKRSRTDRLWLGVAGGMAQSLRLDANLIRLFWILFSLGTMGFGVLLYAVLGAVLPVRTVDVTSIDYSDEAKHVQIIDSSAK